MTDNNSIKLSEVLRFSDLNNVKIRFNLMFRDNWNPLEIFKNDDIDILMEGQYWNYNTRKSYKKGQISLGFIKMTKNEDLWLLFHVGKIVNDLDTLNGMGYEYINLPEYDKYVGRLIIRYKNKSQNMIRKAVSVIDECYVEQILPNTFDSDIFPGYENVNISWTELSRLINKEGWKTALRNQKGVYLITDSSNGKMYVGSAYGENMILGRWLSYVETFHGGNVELKKVGVNHIKSNFNYSILDIFKSTIDDQVIIDRENWWKSVLKTRSFGYNAN